MSSWPQDNRQHRLPDRGHAITSQPKPRHYLWKISTDHAGRLRRALREPIVLIPGTIYLSEAHREVGVSRQAMRMMGWHGNLPCISDDANHQASSDPYGELAPGMERLVVSNFGHPPSPDIARSFGGPDSSRVDRAVRSDVVDLTARRADVLELPVV